MVISIKNLTYVYEDGTVGLNAVNAEIEAGSRVLLVGANGAGKSSLLRLLSGKTIAPANTIAIDGVDPFRSNSEGVRYLGTEWISNPIVRHDMPVNVLLDTMGSEEYRDRCDELLKLLDVDVNWHMNRVSDGERRRVQLAMGLLVPWNILLLDEVTVDLDVLVRLKLMNFLRKETAERGATVVYATHIFDALTDWPTHILHLNKGSCDDFDTYSNLLSKYAPQNINYSPLLNLAITWLTKDTQ
ncbi:hypothetical protein CANCADRAFT_147948 [Tortispora caseinolytica NRRL Y-17796]|uniref:ABC transporter domain-containing protein n=1 Tax=Tortispora caseinolytica NRRL Y-17796 TaxID=767744 RepID=A0A1E4TF30_9ASCO|nr:hypothetical protein CANCADRAFT_147948 [Tortispora caseinolytica NRRL Y-17796]